MRRIKPRFVIGLVIGLFGFSFGVAAAAVLRLRHARGSAVAGAAAATAEPDPQFVYKVELGSAPALGAAEPLVTIVSFSQYRCARCRELERSLRRLVDADPQRVRVVWKDLPGDGNARWAVRGARAAQAQGRFWELHDRLMQVEVADEKALLREAERLGLDVGRLRAALDESALDRSLAADAAQAQLFGLRRAPAVFVNGKFVAEPTDEKLAAALVTAQEFATRLVAEGTPRGKVYSALMRGALEHTGPISDAPLPENLRQALQALE